MCIKETILRVDESGQVYIIHDTVLQKLLWVMVDTLMIYSNMKYKGEGLSIHMSTEETGYAESITLSTYNE